MIRLPTFGLLARIDQRHRQLGHAHRLHNSGYENLGLFGLREVVGVSRALDHASDLVVLREDDFE